MSVMGEWTFERLNDWAQLTGGERYCMSHNSPKALSLLDKG